jgi:molecular chaperone GrpE (heat shock protein)
MAKHKTTLKAIAEKLGIPENELSEIDIEDIGTLPGVAERYKLADEHGELKRQLDEKGSQLQQVAMYFQQLQQARQQQYNQAGYQAPEWFQDPILEPVGRTLMAMQQQYDGATQALAQRVEGIHREGARILNKLQKFVVKAENPDFDENKITEWARKKNFQGDWEESYRAYKAENLDALIEDKVKAAREAAIKEAHEKLNAPLTEMGGESGTPPAVGSKPKDYDSAWQGLVAEVQGLGFGSH